ncbi:MAG TPA: hypothetical protein VLK84_04130 [Longimicrobium sp.]|nr:hypothetical protein [Longimicrobium sp.]
MRAIVKLEVHPIARPTGRATRLRLPIRRDDRLEERFLLRELPGYAAYAERVRHRLIPGLW